MKKTEYINKILATIPNNPGVYRYFNKEGTVIYVGKAKNLKNRVKSYFMTKKHESAKTRILVKQIVDIKYIIAPTEYEALLLENTLIKKHRPKYNIRLKDDKTYPWICITKEPFPRIFPTRNTAVKKSEYIGPYTNVKVMYAVLELVKEIYHIRSCRPYMDKQLIEKRKFKVCLDYHIKKCLGPCEGYQSQESYSDSILQIKKILKGKVGEVITYAREEMVTYSNNLEFEKAQKVKEKLILLENYQVKSTVVNANISDVDIFSIISDANTAYVNFIKVVNGAIVQSYTTEVKKKLEEDDQNILAYTLVSLREKFNSDSKQIFTSIPIDLEFDENIKLTVPQIGDKKKLVDFSLANVRQYKFDKYKTIKITDPEGHANRIVKQIQKDLRLKEPPVHIECFDNSNFHGTNAVAACVVFKNAKPSKKDYRHFNIKTVVGSDDFASMREVVFRRYSRLKNENQPLPQLIIVDGGKGQLSSAVSALKELDLFGRIAIVGIAKKLEEIFFPNDSIPIYIDKRSESLKTIQQLRNEAHRFGITHHRDKRSKNAIVSELSYIKGIGEKSMEKLLKHFKTVSKIRQANQDQLLEIVNLKQAKAVLDYFSKEKTN